MLDVPVPLAHITGAGWMPAVVVGLAILAVAAHWAPGRAGLASDRSLLAVAYGAVAFQLVHALEHLLQIGYWVLNPIEPPWLTPWAAVGRDLLAGATDGRTSTGDELLHLGGNLVFLAGLVAAVALVRRWEVPARRVRWLRWALWLQAAHVVEHVVLTATAVTGGVGHGVSTGFALLTPGTVLAVGVRVWLHVLLNLVATAFAVAGILQLRSVRRSPDAVAREPLAAR